MTPARQSRLIAYHFGPFRLSVGDRILERNGERIQLTPKAIDTLFVLVENAKQVVTKEALMKAVWPDVTVVESGLTRNISNLRKALEQDGEEGSYIETIPKRGYRFRAPVTEEEEAIGQLADPDPALAPEAPQLAATPDSPTTSVHQRRSYSLWLVALIALLALSVLAVIEQGRNRPRVKAVVHPSVRIGEHLLYKLAPDETVRASEHFMKAIDANPRAAGAYAGLSTSLLHLAMLGVRSLPEVLPQARPAALKAVELDPNSGTAHYAVALLHMVEKWDFRAAEREFQRALDLEPESVQSRLGFARLQLARADTTGALKHVEEALALDPASPPLGAEYCRIFYLMKDFKRAEAECRKVLDREPGYALAHYYRALSLGLMGRIPEARESLQRTALMPGVLEADYARLSLHEGDRQPALKVLERRRQLIRQGDVEPVAKLLPATILNRIDEAYEALEAGLLSRAPDLLDIQLEPRLEALRRDPRYPSLLRRTGLSER